MAKNTARPSNNTDTNTSQDEIESAARRAGLFTTPMIATKLNLSEGTVRNRIKTRKVQPAAKIHPKSRGRYSLAFSKESVEQIGKEGGEVSVEMIGSAR